MVWNIVFVTVLFGLTVYIRMVRERLRDLEQDVRTLKSFNHAMRFRALRGMEQGVYFGWQEEE